MKEVLLNKLGFEPVLKPGYRVLILPKEKYGWYEMPKDQVPEILPRQIVNLASATAQLESLVQTGSIPSVSEEIEELEMDKNELAQLRIVVLDDILVEVFQPATVGKYNNTTGPLKVGKGETDLNYTFKDSLLPEIYVFGKNTSPTLKVFNNTFRDTMNARVAFFGYKYPLRKINEPEGEQPTFILSIDGTASKS